MQATPKFVIPDLIGSLGTRSFMLVCLCAAFPTTSNGDPPAVGVIQGDVFMSWGIHTTDISSDRLVWNQNKATVIFFHSNSVNFTIPPAFSSRVRDIGNVSLGIVSFRLLNLTVADAGRYFYRLVSAADEGGQVIVLVIAGKPAVSVMEAAYPFENEKYTMKCSAQSTSVPPGMGLTMRYQWKMENGQNITVSDRYSFSSDQANLTINPLKRQDAGTFLCEAWEHVGAVSHRGPFSLKVIYGPDPESIRLSPNRTSDELTESSSFTVNCSADCFPDCQYRWTGPDGSNVSSTGLLSLIYIGRNQAGQYTCTASNSRSPIKTATSAISVTVFYGPDDGNVSLSPGNTSYQLTELSHLAVQCAATCVPQCYYEWSGPRVSQNDSLGWLSISQITRNQNGTFICTVINPRIPGKSATANFSVIIYYGPDIPRLSPSTTVYTKLEGESVPDINCSADCFPGCTQVWIKGVATVQESNGETLSLGQVTREKAGDYTCWFSNKESKATGNISIKLIVQYPPVLKMMATNTSKGGRVIINCTASGVPDNYTFYKLTHMVHDVSRTIVRELELTRVSNRNVSFTIEGATYQDTGFYVCKASNGIAHYNSEQLVMEDMVSIWITDQPVITSNARDFDAEKGQFGQIYIEFYTGLTQPLVKWYIDKNGAIEQLHNSSKFGIFLSNVTVDVNYYQRTVQLPGYNASLQVFDVAESQFTSYRVEINNSFAEPAFVTLELKPRVTKYELGNYNGSPVIIGAATGSALVLVIAVAIVGFHFYKRRQSIKSSEEGLADNPVYDSSGPLPDPSTSVSATGMEYATAVKPKTKGGQVEDLSSFHAKVEKTKNGKKKVDIYEDATLAGKDNLKGNMYTNSGELKADENIYENPSEKAPRGSSATKDGLLYADLVLDTPTTKNGKYVIRGLENCTEYVEIAYGKRGEPLPDDGEEQKINAA